ncbi:DUF4130 domain-containing protein [Myxococcus sp. Y35]|uniref:DUF4130 domain-containing protein n=1 Tax=Pseudomyxococcus flavus TaxID=3115648 RepID=UPI003CE8B7B4
MDVRQEGKAVSGAWRARAPGPRAAVEDAAPPARWLTRVSVAPDLGTFRVVARGLLAREEPPERVRFEEVRGQTDALRAAVRWEACGRLAPALPRDFLGLARTVVCHRAPARWALLYRVLWRLTHGEPELLHRHDDPDVRRLRWMEQAVRRDVQAMTAAVRFRRVWRDGGAHHVAWFQPEHAILREVAPFLVRRFPTFSWSLFTPEACVHWDRERLTFEDGGRLPAEVLRGAVPRPPRPEPEPARMPLLWVGAAPRSGEPPCFAGPAGQLLDVVLGRAGLPRPSADAAHVVVPCRPGCGTERGASLEGEGRSCRHGLSAVVARVRPRLIIALGAVAAQAFLGIAFRIHLSRGRVLSTPWADGWMATLAPEAVLQLPGARERAEARIHLEADLRAAAAWLRQQLHRWGRPER